MRPSLPLLLVFLFAGMPLAPQAPRPGDVQERRLPNGARLLVVERKGLPAFHATLVFRGGSAEEPLSMAGATEVLARTLYGHTWPEDVEEPGKGSVLDDLLRQEEGLMEALRLDRLRQRRDPAATSQSSGLEAGLQGLRTRMASHFATAPLQDLYAARGGRQSAEARADALIAETELPLEAFEVWCRTEAQRLRRLQLSRFATERQALLSDLKAPAGRTTALLPGAALPGHPYGRDLADHTAGLEAMRWSDLRAQARKACAPEHLAIILVGGLSLETVVPLVTRYLGSLPTVSEGEASILPDIAPDLGDRRVQASLGTESSLRVGWRIPSRNHADHLPLEAITELLGGGRTARLTTRLVQQKRLAKEAQIVLDEPGAQHPGLLTVELHPTPGHSLAELEGALQTEILRLQQELIPSDEWQRAIARMETSRLLIQDEPAALAKALGLAWAESGDWRTFYTETQRLRTLGPEAVQVAAQAWLKPTHRTTALLEPGAGQGQDPLDLEITAVLQALAARRIEDLGRRETLVNEGLRQLRMLPLEERRHTLQLLQAQLTVVAR